ncbi:hypothetical protein KP22_07400 [Pectobacterium betavasculorum]|uniref:Uncharacterized protein n=1 Tax=Pectobacterium betavasculorum TaxID=55207 RepID=A0A093SCR7_9GAMM|nr:hypothetical protein KP22_07400 [Pectobacterium betavasculorum]
MERNLSIVEELSECVKDFNLKQAVMAFFVPYGIRLRILCAISSYFLNVRYTLINHAREAEEDE